MCLIIAQPAGKLLPEDYYKNAFEENEDGGGICYVQDDQLVVEKGFMNFTAMYEAIKKNHDKELVIHFRAASPGMVINEKNCHPFYFSGKRFQFEVEGKKVNRYQFAVVHNGKLAWRDTKDRSDTNCFTGDLLAPALDQNPFMLDFAHGITLLERTIGDRNKMVVMRYDVQQKEQKVYILNDQLGHWKDDVWFSNHSYIRIAKTTSYSTGGYYGNSTPAHAINEWSIPDKDGWYWSFFNDCWINKNTGVNVECLTSRPTRPYDPKSLGKHNNFLGNKITEGKGPGGATIPSNDAGVPKLTAGDRAEINKDADLLTDEEWTDRYLRRTMRLEGGVNIQVPRDDEELIHLNKSQKKFLRRCAADYCRETNKSEAKRTTNPEMIAWLRSDLREFLPFLKLMTDDQVDRWIIAEDKSGKQLAAQIMAYNVPDAHE